MHKCAKNMSLVIRADNGHWLIKSGAGGLGGQILVNRTDFVQNESLMMHSNVNLSNRTYIDRHLPRLGSTAGPLFSREKTKKKQKQKNICLIPVSANYFKF